MEATVNNLEAKFQKAESDLDYVSRKLDAEYANLADGVEKKNPGKLLEKIGEIKREYANIVKEAVAIQEAQKEAMMFFQTQLLTLCEGLTKLQLTAGGPQAEKPEELTQLESLLGMAPPPPPAPALPADDSQEEDTQEEEAEAEELCQEEEEAPVELSPSERRAGGGELIEVDAGEFSSVSSLVRGRAKLADVNQTYRVLWTHFKEEGNSKPLSPAEMFKMGLRVTGQTGEAKLKVLRSLKLLEIAKNGSVKLT